MKLSEAILLGSINTEQAFGKFYSNGKTCAQGAALDAVGCLDKVQQYTNHSIHDKLWPWAAEKGTMITCPTGKCHEPRSFVRSFIAHLNNDHRWTRPQIAA